jgi:murein L,D-transpeptidase YcbB/YkuD
MSSSPNPPIPPRNTSKGSSGVLIAFLAIAAIGLAILSISLWNNNSTLRGDVKALEEAKAAEELKRVAAEAQVTKLNQDLQRAVMVSRLPAGMNASGPIDALAKIEKLYADSIAGAVPGGSGPTPVPGPGTLGGSAPAIGDTAIAAALEAVSKAVVTKALDTKAAVAPTDSARITLHRQVQSVLARIGAFNKPVSGNQKDTLEAVQAFQKANGLKVDGVIGRGTWGKVREKYEAMTRGGAAPQR